MKKIQEYQSGQAIILIVFAIIGLLGMTALTVDGSNAYSDRRHAQNAADTAVLAAARAKIREEDWRGAALQLANANSYMDTDHTENSSSPHVNVEVYLCSEVDCNITPKPGDTLQDYIQVKITSTIKTYFGGVIGVWQVTNKVNSIARVKSGSYQPQGNGNAIYSLNETECKAVEYQGAANVTLIGAGIHSNSDSSCAFFNQSQSTNNKLTAPCIQTYGGIQATGSVDVPQECMLTGQQVLPPPVLPDPPPSCGTKQATINPTTKVMSPGNWSGAFPGNATFLEPGLYCVKAGQQGFKLSGSDSLSGVDVTIYMETGNVDFVGQVEVNIDAPGIGTGEYPGLLIYLPPSNDKSVSIGGGGTSSIIGTILAPSSECKMAGGGSQDGMQTQLICDMVKLTGNSDTTIVYNPDVIYTPWVHPQLELTK
jgi:hypothetical protein